MKKLIKFLLKAALVFVVLLVAGVITLKVMYPPEKLKEIALNYAKENLHREITFSDVSLNLVGVTLDNFALSEDGGFSNGTFAKADKLVVKVALKPLFKKHIEISTVGLDGLDVKIIKLKNGKFNFDSMLDRFASDPAAPQKPAAEQKESSSFSLFAEKIYANDCDVSYSDQQTGMDASVEHINLNISNFDLTNPFNVQLDLTAEYKEASGLAMTLPVSVNAVLALADGQMDKAYATLKNASVQYKNAKVAVWGDVKNFTTPNAKLKGRISGISNATLSDFVKDLPVFALPEINIDSEINANINNSNAVINYFQLSVRDSKINASGQANWGGKTPTYNLAVSINLMLKQIAEMTAMLDSYGFDGVIKGNLTATDKNDGQDVKGAITLQNLTVKYDPVVLSGLNGVIEINSVNSIACNSLKGLLNQQVFTSSFSYNNVRDVMNLVFNFDLSKLTLSRFPGAQEGASQQPAAPQPTQPKAAAEPETFFNVRTNIKVGEINVPYFRTDGFSLTANLQNVSPSMSKASGTVTFDLQQGAVKDLDTFVVQNKIVKILLLPIAIVKQVSQALNIDLFPVENPQDKGQIKYAFGKGVYTFTNGLMTIDQTHFSSKLTDLQAAGTINFVSQALDMRVAATVLTSQTPIVIKIGGTLDKPSGKLDVLNTVGSLVGGLLSPKTPGKVVKGAVDVTGSVAKGALTTTGNVTKGVVDVGAETVKGTVGVAVDTLKGLGGLFKKKDDKKDQAAASK